MMRTIENNGNGSSTVVVELPALSQERALADKHLDDSSAGALPSPITATPHLERWNHPRSNIWKCLATFWCFMVLGANDAAYGALIPYLERWYDVNYTVISLVFLSPIVGYSMAALLNNRIHVVFGQRGVAFAMSLSHVIAYVVISVHPPYPVLVVVFVLAGFGNGLGDSGWNAWVGDMANANEVLGFLHAFYGLGAALAPLIATSLITRAGWRWYEFYYLMVGAAVIEVAALVGTFWTSDGAAYRMKHPHTADDDVSGTSTPDRDQPGTEPQKTGLFARINPFSKVKAKKTKKGRKSKTAEAVKNKVTVLVSFFLLIYVGAEVSIGGWIVVFMLNVRDGSPFASGMVSTGFWLGITVGRMVLGFVTARVFRSEKHAVGFYLICTVALQLMFWLIPNFYVSAVMVSFVGFFLGPLFPAAVVALTKLLPKRLHVAAVGFAAAFGASGACALPFAVGAIANAKGVTVLQPIILAALAACLITWVFIPKLPKQRMV